MGARGVTFRRRTQSIAAWSRELGISATTLARRLGAGWTVRAAFTTPPEARRNALEHGGRTQSIGAWARELGISYSAMRQRIAAHGLEEALSRSDLPRRGVLSITAADGRSQTVREWADELQITQHALRLRLRSCRLAGRPESDAVSRDFVPARRDFKLHLKCDRAERARWRAAADQLGIPLARLMRMLLDSASEELRSGPPACGAQRAREAAKRAVRRG